jgi:hypothetical protein
MVSVQEKSHKNTEIKRERFVRIAERRVNKILDDLDSLGKCADKKNYDYTAEDAKKIFRVLDSKMRDIKSLYRNLNQRPKRFSLNGE